MKILALAPASLQNSMEDRERPRLYSSTSKKIQTRGLSSRRTHEDFINEKLIQQGQALEHIVKMLQKHEDLIKEVIDNFSRIMQKPQLPEKVDVPLKEPQNEEEETNPFSNRRFMNMKPHDARDSEPNAWCVIGVVCKRTHNPVCGYDETFGYGKFEDICHMFHTNCYWKYNFSLSSSCGP